MSASGVTAAHVHVHAICHVSGAADWSLVADKSGLSEALNVAWASHEIVSDTTPQMLDWFEQQVHKSEAGPAAAVAPV